MGGSTRNNRHLVNSHTELLNPLELPLLQRSVTLVDVHFGIAVSNVRRSHGYSAA